MENKRGLTGNQLKILAMVTMTLDHVGLSLLPQYPVLRLLGRLAMPIYAFLIAQGCRHTRSRGRYLLRLFGLGAVCQGVYYFAMGSVYMGILITFSLSVVLIWALERAKEMKKTGPILTAAAAVLGAVFVCRVLPGLLPGTDFGLDYGIFGVLLPVAAYFWGLPGMGIDLALLCLSSGGNQWWSLLSLLPLVCYNGQRGKWKLGTFFYLYYPVHLAVIQLIAWAL